ncbi:MAG: hypothetical protein IKZ92_09695 [Muribaculaceae bacterium]|nr:hypothetical protein [Muribaculaceae bacterium]
MNKSLLYRLFALGTVMMCVLDASAAEAYLNYTPSNTTMTFYYDDQKSSRPGTTYYINQYSVSGFPAWFEDGNSGYVTRVVFDSSFAEARPTKTTKWFYGMRNLQSIIGMNYLDSYSV